MLGDLLDLCCHLLNPLHSSGRSQRMLAEHWQNHHQFSCIASASNAS
jgi:hypothetical protein